MCGIVGIISPNNQSFIQELTATLSHRGPDFSNTYSDENIALGHTRLSIQDLSESANQPFENEDNVLIFNGEIYNHLEIRKSLTQTEFQTHSDTETLFYGLIEFGSSILNQLNGIFAFAFYNKKTNNLILARDHFGVKPLYYYQKDNEFIFSSEIKTFLKLPNFDNELNSKAILDYTTLLYASNNKTPFQNIKKLEAGHCLELNTKRVKDFKIEKYYQIPFNGNYSITDEKSAIETLDKQLHKTIKKQLVSDVEIGFFLSGGLDSSLLVVLASKYLKQKTINCYTIHSKNLESDGFVSDLKYAKLVAKENNLKLNIIPVEIDIEKEFDQFVFDLDEPIGDSAAIHTYLVCKQAKKDGIKVLISGTGADDIFSGYRRHQALKLEPFLEKTPNSIGKGIKKILNLYNSTNPNFRRIQKLVENIEKPTIERLFHFHQWINDETINKLFTPKFKSKIAKYTTKDIFLTQLESIPKEENLLNKMLYWELKNFLPENNLSFTDKMSMVNGVEVRVPFLDKELVELSTKIHPDLKLKGNETKYILKKVAERYLPKEVIYRSKTGFGASLKQWITNDLEHYISITLSEKSIIKRGIFDFNKINQLIQENKSGKTDYSQTIWTILVLESWLKQYLN